MKKWKLDIRDVSKGLKKLRDALLGRPHTLDGRFPPQISSRTIPPPDIPRGPDTKYSNQYYFRRSALTSVDPPVIAPIAEGPAPIRDPLLKDPTKKAESGMGIKPDSVAFSCAPTPGLHWWWDGHCYYECVVDKSPPPASPPPPICEPRPPTCPCPPPCPPC